MAILNNRASGIFFFRKKSKSTDSGNGETVSKTENVVQVVPEAVKKPAPEFNWPANPKELNDMMTNMIGPERDWSSRSAEANQFKKIMEKIRSFGDKKQLLRQYVNKLKRSPLIENPTELQGKFLVYIAIPMYNRSRVSNCKYDWTAAQFIEDFILRLNEIYEKELESSFFVLKHNDEYFFGDDVPFYHYKYCYSLVQEKKKPQFQLISIPEAFGIDPTDIFLEIIEYPFDKMNEAEIPTHDELKFETSSWFEMKEISLWDLNVPFMLKITGVDVFTPSEYFNEQYIKKYGKSTDDLAIYVVIELFHGAFKLTGKHFTRIIPFHTAPRWNEWIEFKELMISEIPLETKVSFTIYCKPYSKKDVMHQSDHSEARVGKTDFPLAMVCSSLFTYNRYLRSGIQTKRMWPDEKGKLTTSCVENLSDDITLPPTTLSFQFIDFALPVIYPKGEPPNYLKKKLIKFEEEKSSMFEKLDKESMETELRRICTSDPLYKMTEEEKWRMWDSKRDLLNRPEGLIKFLRSVPWNQPYAVYQVHQLIKQWEPLTPLNALQLLDYNYADNHVRQHALSLLHQMDDDQLSRYLLQLVQTLKYELNHDSSLARFLILRGLRSPRQIGHILFWHLAGEMHVPSIRERYGLILQTYLKNCGTHIVDLAKQKYVLNDLNRIALLVKKGKKKSEYKEILQRELSKVSWPVPFKFPLSPHLSAKNIRISKCRVMSSKKLPLWLVFENAVEGEDDIYIMHKMGDDIRQDMLTLQVLSVMDDIWKKEGLDLRIQAYGCVCTGDENGQLQIVRHADTIAWITNEAGGAAAAKQDHPLIKYLTEKNRDPEELKNAINEFVYSCAGYCVATYVMGIGDRHNDNIMLKENGILFHIDFGHFLGNFKTVLGISRETSPFIFTPMYAKVLGGKSGEDYERFCKLGGKAYNILRKNSSLLMTLFMLMLASGIPELQSTKDIKWMRNCLNLDKSDEECEKHFRNLVKASVNNQRAVLNDYFHILKHYSKN